MQQHTCDNLEYLEQLASQLSQGGRLVMRRERSVEESEDREEVGCDVIPNKATDLDRVTSISDKHDLQGVNVTMKTYIQEVIKEEETEDSLVITSTSTVYMDQFEQVSMPSPYPISYSDPMPDPISSKDSMLSTPSPDSMSSPGPFTSTDSTLVLNPSQYVNPVLSPDLIKSSVSLPSTDPMPYEYSMPSEDSKLSSDPISSVDPVPSEDSMLVTDSMLSQDSKLFPLQSTNNMPSDPIPSFSNMKYPESESLIRGDTDYRTNFYSNWESELQESTPLKSIIDLDQSTVPFPSNKFKEPLTDPDIAG